MCGSRPGGRGQVTCRRSAGHALNAWAQLAERVAFRGQLHWRLKSSIATVTVPSGMSVTCIKFWACTVEPSPGLEPRAEHRCSLAWLVPGSTRAKRENQQGRHAEQDERVPCARPHAAASVAISAFTTASGRRFDGLPIANARSAPTATMAAPA